MDEALAYIEAYFKKQLSGDEMRQFEDRCEQDPQFAQDVAFYITTRAAVKEALMEQKKTTWAARQSGPEPAVAATPAPVRKLAVTRWLPYAVAAALLLFTALYFFNDRQSLNRQVASNVEQEISSLSPTMDATADSLELGKRLFNAKNYPQASRVFSALIRSDSTNDDAVLYEGYVYLGTKEYDKALSCFQELAGRQLSSNRGPYLAALTLLERRKNGDQEQARQLLQHVVDGTLEGSEEARRLLKLME